jgi:hypothetical protein
MTMGISNITGYGNAANVVGSSRSQNTQPTLFDYLDGTAGTESSDNLFDLLDLSPEAQAAADALGNSSTNTGASLLSTLLGANTIDGMQASADDAFASVQSKLRTLFQENGIDSSQEIKLQVGSDGNVIVANDHPQKAEIEQLFKDDPSLRDEYVKFTAMSELAASAREAIAFQAAYANDPTAAVAKYSYLFDNQGKSTLSLSILDDTYQSLFEHTGQEPTVVSTSKKE